MASRKRASGKRETIAPKGDKRYTRRKASGEFAKDQDDVGRSLSADVRQQAKTKAKSGQGDRGDQQRTRSSSGRSSSGRSSRGRS